MTREEERQQAAIDYCNNLIREATFGQFVAHMAGSKWADEHPKADTRNDAVTGRKGAAMTKEQCNLRQCENKQLTKRQKRAELPWYLRDDHR